MNQEYTNQNVDDNLASNCHNNFNVMAESVAFDDTNSELHSNIPSVLANKNPHDSSSISLLTTQPDSTHQNQLIEYNNNRSFQQSLEEARNVHNNHITDSTFIQYLSANTSLVIFLFKNYLHVILQPYANEYKEWYENETSDLIAKKVRDSLQMNSICPFDLQQVNTDVFPTYLLSIKRSNNEYFSFSCYDGKCSAFLHLTA